MKNYLLFLTIIFTATIISCTEKEDSASSPNTVTSPFTVKYEIISTAAVHASYGVPMVTYVNSTGQKQTESVPASIYNFATSWSKTISVTTTSRPLQLNLLLSTSPPNVYRLWLKNAGNITQNIYVNGVLVASSNNASSTIANSGEFNIQILGLDYTIK